MHKLISSSLLAALVFAATPAVAIDGEILITQQKAVDGTVPGTDSPGFPITISQAGSYKLAGNLIVTKAGANGIVVTAHDVTIDFNGFRLHGGAIGNHGISGSVNSLTIKNGMIANFVGNGIQGSGPFWTIDNMRIVFNRQNGILAQVGSGPQPTARQWLIADSQIVENEQGGIQAAAAGAFLIRNNVVNGNKREGILASHAHIEGNLVSGNGIGGGLHQNGIILQKGMLLANTVTDNMGFGFAATNSSVGFGNNTFSGNGAGQASGGTAVHPNVCGGVVC